MCEKVKKKISELELDALISSQPVASSVVRRAVERIKVKQSLRAVSQQTQNSSKIYSQKKVPVFPQTEWCECFAKADKKLNKHGGGMEKRFGNWMLCWEIGHRQLAACSQRHKEVKHLESRRMLLLGRCKNCPAKSCIKNKKGSKQSQSRRCTRFLFLSFAQVFCPWGNQQCFVSESFILL